jgi:hypothetical protein
MDFERRFAGRDDSPPAGMRINLPSTGSHRLDWTLMLALAIVLLVIFV